MFLHYQQFITWCLGVWISINCGMKWKETIKRGMMALFKKCEATAQKRFSKIGFTLKKTLSPVKLSGFPKKRCYNQGLLSGMNFLSSSKFSWEKLLGNKEWFCLDFVAGGDFVRGFLTVELRISFMFMFHIHLHANIPPPTYASYVTSCLRTYVRPNYDDDSLGLFKYVTVAYLKSFKRDSSIVVVCNRRQSSSSLTILVSLWFIIIYLVFFYFSKLLF